MTKSGDIIYESQKESSILLELPTCPSTNTLFTGMKRRRKSDEYKNWLILVNIEFNKLYKKYNYKITGDSWLEVHLNHFFSLYTLEGNKRVKDCANYEKAMIDYLATKIKGFKDHKIKRIIQEKHDSELNITKIRILEIN